MKIKILILNLFFRKILGLQLLVILVLRVVKKKLIAFLDADDEWHEDKLKLQVDLYNKLSEEGIKVGLIECFMKDISPKKTVIASQRVLAGDSFELF